MKKENVLKNEVGITLIALVISIVVMLILAGVTINLTIGENGIFTAAIDAREHQKIAEYKEKIELARASVALENMGEVTLDKLIAKIYEQKIVPENAITKLDDEKAKMTTKEGYLFIITADSIQYVGKGEEIPIPPSLQEANVTISEPIWDTTTHTATVTITKANNLESDLSIQYQIVTNIDDIKEENWKKGTSVSGIKLNEYVCVRLWNGYNGGNFDSLKITETTAPEVATITGISKPTLTSQITGSDYGKYIDYSVTVEGEVLDDWKVFYNDKTTGNVYIILDGYLPNRLIPEETKVTTNGTYAAYWDINNAATNIEVEAILTNTKKWEVFATGIEGATATGSPTMSMFVDSWNENPAVNSTKLIAGQVKYSITDTTGLYIPFTTAQDECLGYWFASRVGNDSWMWQMGSNRCFDHGNIFSYGNYKGVRPVVCLPSGISGTVGNTVELGEIITTENPAKATVTLVDNESGVDIKNSKYVYTQTESALGTTDTSVYTNSFTTNPETITLNATTPGTYYLHVLTVDNAGNMVETISDAVTVKQLVTGVTLNKSEISMAKGSSQTLTATIEPSNVANKNLIWSSSNTNVATVSNGTIVAKEVGITAATVRTDDGTNNTATCIVKVYGIPQGTTASATAGADSAHYVIDGVALGDGTDGWWAAGNVSGKITLNFTSNYKVSKISVHTSFPTGNKWNFKVYNGSQLIGELNNTSAWGWKDIDVVDGYYNQISVYGEAAGHTWHFSINEIRIYP